MIEPNKVKQLLERGTINIFISYAKKSFKNECCGIMCIDRDNIIIFPSHNVVESLNDLTLTGQNSFMIDGKCWDMVKNSKFPVLGVYHSHTNGITDFSDFDKQTLKWRNLYYLIIGVKDYNATSAKLFWWNNELLNELSITI